MSLSVDTVGNGAKCDENESPLCKRKSELISPSSRRTTTSSTTDQAQHHRGPLSDVNSNPEKTSAATTDTPSKPHRSTPPTPTRSSLPPPYSANKFNSTNVNKFKLPSSRQQQPAPSKDEIQATDEKQASVNQLSEWLATESARKKKKPPMHRPLSSSSPAPLRFLAKPLHKKSDVQATNSKAASVKTLSSWMNDGDPFSQKKVRTIRSGHKVIAKSRIFEKEGASLIVRKECDIRAGSVRGKSAWLSEAFKSEGEEKPQPLMEKKIRPYQCKPKESTPVKELKSVRDKKEWLSNAFKKGGEKEAQLQLQHSIIHQTKSFDVQVNSSDAATPGIRKCASTDDGTTHHPAMMIQQTKSCDGMRPPLSCTSATSTSSERQHNVVRLYQSTPKKGEEEKSSTEETLKTVHDKQAWLSSAFKKPIGSAVSANGKEDAEEKKLIDAPLNNIAKESVDEKSLDIPVVEATKTKETVSDDSEKGKISVPDRAKWDRAKWPYKKSEEKSPEKTLKTVHDKQTWSSSAFKKPISGSATANGKEETEEKKLIEANSAKKTVDEKSLDKHVVEATKTKLAVSDDIKKDNMSVAERAKWLKAAFK